jgi:hypothetical protein
MGDMGGSDMGGMDEAGDMGNMEGGDIDMGSGF